MNNDTNDLDADLSAKSREDLLDEVKALRAAIRRHRDCSGQELCWYHPALWSLLPEKATATPVVPDWPQFMEGCLNFRKSLDAQLPNAPRSDERFNEDKT